MRRLYEGSRAEPLIYESVYNGTRMAKQDRTEFLREIGRLLKYHQSLGIREYPRTKALARFLQKRNDPDPLSLQTKNRPAGMEMKPSRNEPAKHFFDPNLEAKATLTDVREEVGECTRCRLYETRTRIVFGQGLTSARLMIITDAPAEEDDREGSPFRGAAGELLDRMLAAIDLSREDVYITSLVKCFPGPRAKPREAEIKTCLPFLFRQVEIICPTVICAMGMLAAQTLLHSRGSLFQLRGRFFNFNDLCQDELEKRIIVMPSLHPSLLLQNADLKKASWHDLQMIQKKLEENDIK